MLGAAVTVRRHRDAGRVSIEQLEARLCARAIELLDEKIEIGRWYPVEPFCELFDLDWDIAGNRDADYARQAGVISAEKLFDTGIYQQLDYAQRAERVQSSKDLGRQARLITTITGTLYSFLDFQVRVDEGARRCLEIHYGNAGMFGEALRYSTEGFMNQINRRQGSSREWTSERVSEDLIVFRLPLPARFATLS